MQVVVLEGPQSFLKQMPPKQTQLNRRTCLHKAKRRRRTTFKRSLSRRKHRHKQLTTLLNKRKHYTQLRKLSRARPLTIPLLLLQTRTGPRPWQPQQLPNLQQIPHQLNKAQLLRQPGITTITDIIITTPRILLRAH
jgi:hypothetical protein